ncbi:Uncharacterised protein [Acinetobacter baumannii]|nr:Uncharacterised protein [Acinetobacter baumannii]
MQRRSVEVLSSFIRRGPLEVKEGEPDGTFGSTAGHIAAMPESIHCPGNALSHTTL